MNPSITFTKITDPISGEMTVHVQASCTKEDALELLAYGSKSVRECLGISLTDYLEAIIAARETSPIFRTIIDHSMIPDEDKEADS